MQTDHVSRNSLVSQAQQGNAAAVEQLLRLSTPRLLQAAKRMLRDDDIARDMVQDTLLSLVQNLPNLRSPCAFQTWAGRILRNRCISEIRRQQIGRRLTTELEEHSAITPETDCGIPDAGSRGELIETIRTLGDRQREVVKLHYLLGLSIKEVAAAVDVSAGAVKLRLHRARVELRARLGCGQSSRASCADSH